MKAADNPRVSLRRKLLVAYVPSIVLAVTVAFTVFEYRSYRDNLDGLRQNLHELASPTAALLAAPVWHFDTATLDHIMDVLARDPNMESVAVLDETGQVMVSRGPVDAEPMNDGFRATEPIVFQDSDGGKIIGTLVITFRPDGVFEDLERRIWESALIVLILIAIIAAVTYGIASRMINMPLRRLLGVIDRARSENVREDVDWTSNDELGAVVNAYNDLQQQHWAAEDVQSELIALGVQLSAERDTETLLETILLSAMRMTGADGGTVYLERDDHLEFSLSRNTTLGLAVGGSGIREQMFEPLALFDADGSPITASLSARCFHKKSVIDIPNVATETRFPLPEVNAFDQATGYSSVSVLTLPMTNREYDVVGVLQLVNATSPETGKHIPFNEKEKEFVEALASQGAVAIENQNLLESQEALLEGMIELTAGAIDSKSPYTGGHCARVPEAARMLAEAACNQTEGPFADFSMDEQEWQAFHIASWLHDCGKVTTPEYVVDKAVKLETIANRIHEIRTRFEVLRRDAEIEYYRAVADGADPTQAADDRDARFARLDADFAFVAECNIGGETLDPAKVERIRKIASQTWTRHFDDRLGLSHDERLRKLRGGDPPPLPAVETLLADKPEHVVERQNADAPFGDNPLGFQMDVPEHLYNFGEIYNLCIERGTLTAEERFKINDHIIQTIIMLSSLPWPRHLRRVPEIAGGHHEKMDGTGYPRRLNKDEMSVPARIMAIADIFEALTAADRPYKSAKTLSESIRIMAFMERDNHIDPELFRLFLQEGVHKAYADRFLQTDQIDEVDVASYLGKAAE